MSTQTLTMYGASDDLVEFDGAISEEFNAAGPWRGELTSPDGESLIVTAEYSKRGSDAEWTLGVENSGTWPGWAIRFAERPDREGDPAISFEVPEGTTIKEIN